MVVSDLRPVIDMHSECKFLTFQFIFVKQSCITKKDDIKIVFL